MNADFRRLLSLEKTLLEKPGDETAMQEAAGLAAKLAPHLSGNRLVWQMLVKTRTLKDGMSLADAEKLLGAPTEKSANSVGWYHNPHGAHVAPYLKAKITSDELAEWKLNNH